MKQVQIVRLKGLPALKAKINMKQKIRPQVKANVREDKA